MGGLITLHERNGKDLKVPKQLTCASCKQATMHDVRHSVWIAEDFPDGTRYVDDYMIVRCRGCETLSFCIEKSNSEDFEPDEMTGQTVRVSTYTRYPSIVVARNAMPSTQALPENVNRIYWETLAALSNRQPILAGIGIRAIVESVCKNRKARGANLRDRIDDLMSKQLITKQGASTLHKLRFMGNAAAHETKPHNTVELEIAFEVVEHLLKDVYVLATQRKKLPRARKM